MPGRDLRRRPTAAPRTAGRASVPEVGAARPEPARPRTVCRCWPTHAGRGPGPRPGGLADPDRAAARFGDRIPRPETPVPTNYLPKTLRPRRTRSPRCRAAGPARPLRRPIADARVELAHRRVLRHAGRHRQRRDLLPRRAARPGRRARSALLRALAGAAGPAQSPRSGSPDSVFPDQVQVAGRRRSRSWPTGCARNWSRPARKLVTLARLGIPAQARTA